MGKTFKLIVQKNGFNSTKNSRDYKKHYRQMKRNSLKNNSTCEIKEFSKQTDYSFNKDRCSPYWKNIFPPTYSRATGCRRHDKGRLGYYHYIYFKHDSIMLWKNMNYYLNIEGQDLTKSHGIRTNDLFNTDFGNTKYIQTVVKKQMERRKEYGKKQLFVRCIKRRQQKFDNEYFQK